MSIMIILLNNYIIMFSTVPRCRFALIWCESRNHLKQVSIITPHFRLLSSEITFYFLHTNKKLQWMMPRTVLYKLTAPACLTRVVSAKQRWCCQRLLNRLYRIQKKGGKWGWRSMSSLLVKENVAIDTDLPHMFLLGQGSHGAQCVLCNSHVHFKVCW